MDIEEFLHFKKFTSILIINNKFANSVKCESNKENNKILVKQCGLTLVPFLSFVETKRGYIVVLHMRNVSDHSFPIGGVNVIISA